MLGARLTPILFGILALISLSSVPATAPAEVDAKTYFLEGNQAFRDGIYRAALVKYRAAYDAGLDTPLLHYNMGLTHYKLNHYKDAARELQKATEDPLLAPLALYNLGLANRAAGDDGAAQRAFQLAWERSDNRKLRELATQALAELEEPPPTEVVIDFGKKEPVGEFKLVTLARIGIDDNVYRTPRQPYVDLSVPGTPLVTPVIQSGTVAPIDFLAQYLLPGQRGTEFLFTYRLDGDFYLEKELENANRYTHELSFGADTLLGQNDARTRSLWSRFVHRRHDETNFDPDDGLDRTLLGEDLSDRWSYSSNGLEAAFRHELERISWAIDFKTELREYEKTEIVDAFDHLFYFIGGHASYFVTPRLAVRLGIDYYVRDYFERRARNQDGELITTNPLQTYRYQAAETGVTYSLRYFLVGVDYRRTRRDDLRFGYNDYIQDRYRVRMGFRAGRRFKATLIGGQRIYDFPEAFAFNTAAGGPMELDDTYGSLVAQFRVTRSISIWAEYLYRDVVSTDTRIDYERTRYALGVKWEN